MPHMAMKVTTDANAKFVDPEFWTEQRIAEVKGAETLHRLGEILGLTTESLTSLGALDNEFPKAVVQGILGGYRGAAESAPPDPVQVLWVDQAGFGVQVFGSPGLSARGTSGGGVTIVVSAPASLDI